MIEKYIRSILEKDGRIAIPSLGTFTTSPYSTKIDESEKIIAPPGSKISFVENINYPEKEVLIQSIFDELENGDKIQIESDIKKYVDNLKLELKEKGKATINKLGHFEQDNYGDIVFYQDENINFLDSSFGLATMHTSSIPPVVTEDDEFAVEREKSIKEVKRKKLDLILALILIPLILVSAFVCYLFMNDDAMQFFNKSINVFQSNDTEIVENDNNVLISKNDTLEPPKNNDDTGSIKDENKISENTIINPSNNLVVTSKTNRYYLIYGSFSNLANAKASVNKERIKGHKRAKVIHVDNKFRTSIADFQNLENANTELKKYQKKYQGVWVFSY